MWIVASKHLAQRLSAMNRVPLTVRLILACLTFLSCGTAAKRLSAQADHNSIPALPDELSRRIQSAIEARSSGDPETIGKASRQVIALALAEMAKLRVDEKSYRDATKLSEESLEFEDTAETRTEVAIASLYAKNSSEAVKQASLAAEMAPQNALIWIIKGESLLQAQDYPHAATALARALEIRRDGESAYALGIAQLGMGDQDAAAKTFSQFLDLIGDFGWSHVLVGRAYQEQDFMQEARTQYEKALLLDPTTPNAHYFWALNLLKENSWAPTPEVYEQLGKELHLNPRHFEANYMLGSLSLNAGDYKKADQYLHLATEVNPSLPETWVLFGLNAKHSNANHAAEVYFRKAITLAANSGLKEHLEVRKAYYGLGRLLMASSREREGRELLSKARELEAQVVVQDQKKLAAKKGQNKEEDPENVAPYVPESGLDPRPSIAAPSTKGPSTRAAASRRIGPTASAREARAEKRLEAVLGSSFNDLATAEALQEKYDLAYKHYREAESWDARIPGLERNLGLAAFFVGKPSEAIPLLSKALVQAPGDSHARAVLGMAYAATQNFAKAVQTMTPIANQAFQDPQLGFAWAKSLAKTGNKARATGALRKIEKADADPSVDDLIQFGQLWRALGETDHAAESFRRVLQIDPENAEAKCALHLTTCP